MISVDMICDSIAFGRLF